MHHLYRITCLANNKVYIGQAKDYNQRWRQHKAEAKKDEPSMIVNKAMKKYGIDNFQFDVIATCKTIEDANEVETLLVKQYESHISTGKGYNVSNGGMNAPKSDEWKQKVSQSLMGHEVSQEARDKISQGNSGKVRSDEFKKDEGDYWRGRDRSEEHRQGLSESLKGNQNCLGKQNALGYKHSEEAKMKIGEASRNQEKRFQGKTWKLIDGKRVWMDR